MKKFSQINENIVDTLSKIEDKYPDWNDQFKHYLYGEFNDIFHGIQILVGVTTHNPMDARGLRIGKLIVSVGFPGNFNDADRLVTKILESKKFMYQTFKSGDASTEIRIVGSSTYLTLMFELNDEGFLNSDIMKSYTTMDKYNL